jgi:hypothetical protein
MGVLMSLARKLKTLKVDLKKCNEEVFGDVGKIKNFLEDIQELDFILDGQVLTEDERRR